MQRASFSNWSQGEGARDLSAPRSTASALTAHASLATPDMREWSGASLQAPQRDPEPRSDRRWWRRFANREESGSGLRNAPKGGRQGRAVGRWLRIRRADPAGDHRPEGSDQLFDRLALSGAGMRLPGASAAGIAPSRTSTTPRSSSRARSRGSAGLLRCRGFRPPPRRGQRRRASAPRRTRWPPRRLPPHRAPPSQAAPAETPPVPGGTTPTTDIVSCPASPPAIRRW